PGNVVVPGSVFNFFPINTTNSETITLRQKVFISIVTATNYKLTVATGAAGVSLAFNNSNDTADATSGTSGIFWRRLSAFQQMINTADYVMVV
ncbi:hypothetical protein, partial [Klebsiella pneumoniae]|uniref:hypothetical protein n=1 Tax=Klebsiella pneumoniae TaxID=573 RepID=UPI0013308F03